MSFDHNGRCGIASQKRIEARTCHAAFLLQHDKVLNQFREGNLCLEHILLGHFANHVLDASLL